MSADLIGGYRRFAFAVWPQRFFTSEATTAKPRPRPPPAPPDGGRLSARKLVCEAMCLDQVNHDNDGAAFSASPCMVAYGGGPTLIAALRAILGRVTDWRRYRRGRRQLLGARRTPLHVERGLFAAEATAMTQRARLSAVADHALRVLLIELAAPERLFQRATHGWFRIRTMRLSSFEARFSLGGRDSLSWPADTHAPRSCWAEHRHNVSTFRRFRRAGGKR